MRKLIAAAMLMGCLTMAQAQVGSKATPAQAADGMLQMFEGQFMSVAKAMPADKYDFSPASLKLPGAKFEGVRTFAEQVKHVAQANYFFASTLGAKPDVDVKAIGSLKSKDAIVAAAGKSFAFLKQSYSLLTPENAMNVVKFEGATAPLSGVAAFSVVHGFDHYGQMVEYLRMNGIVPEGSK